MEVGRSGKLPWDVLAVTLIILVVGCAYLTWRGITPASCAFLSPDAASWTVDGRVPKVTPGCPLPSGVPLADATVSASEAHLVLTDGTAVTLPRTDPLPQMASRLLAGAPTVGFTVCLFLLCGYAFVRRPSDVAMGAALVLSTGLLASTTVTLVGLPVEVGLTSTPTILFLVNTQVVFSIVWGTGLLFVLLFPTPLAPEVPRLWRRAAIATAPLVVWLLVATAILVATDDPAVRISSSIRAQSMVTAFTMLTIVASALVRMIRMRSDTSDVVARQQLLWLGATSIAALAGGLSFWIIPHAVLGFPLLPDELIGLPGVVAIFGFGIALLRFRMFEFEWLLVRVLVDTVLALLAVGAYVVVVEVLGAVQPTDLPSDDAWVGVLAVMIVALAAPPLRRRIEQGVNWVVYRDPESPYHTLSRVAEALAGRSVDFQRVADDIRRAMRVPRVTIQADGVSAASGTADSVPDATAIRFSLGRGDTDEVMVAYSRGRGDPLSPPERRLLSDLARQIGQALHQLRLTAELQHSREQLVLAREEERRSIRRVMHDDLGPTLAGITLQAETARQLATRFAHPDERLDGVLDGIARDASATSQALRDLSYELRPPALDDRGLVAALADVGLSLAPLAVIVDADACGDLVADPLPAAVEVALYRIATEAMRNVARHAAATSCLVTLRREDGGCRLEVSDDGVGLPDPVRTGVGVASMRERAAELGGSFTLWRRPVGGTLVRVDLPLGDDHA